MFYSDLTGTGVTVLRLVGGDRSEGFGVAGTGGGIDSSGVGRFGGNGATGFVMEIPLEKLR
jgi:hypothetical protein